MKVVRKIGKQERSKGKHLTDIMFKKPPLSGGKDVTSLLLPSKRVEGENTPYSVMCEYNNSVDHEYTHINDKYALERSKVQEREREGEWMFKRQESTNCQGAESRHPGSATYDAMGDALNSDVTTRVPDVNRLIARKRYVPRKRSLMYSVRSFERSLRACSRIITFIVLLLAIIINILGGLINIRPYERKSTVGNSSSLFLSKPLSAIDYRELLFLHLRELSSTILVINEGLWPYLMIETNWKDNKRLKRRREVLHNARIREGGYGQTGYSHSSLGYEMPFCKRSPEQFLAGKRLIIYIFLCTAFWTSSMFYLDTYTANLELNDNFKMFYDHIYLYIYDVYHFCVSYGKATYPEAISVKTYTLVYFPQK